MQKAYSVLACVFLIIAVLVGAFGAHGLKSYFLEHPKYEEIYKTAVFYHFIHGLSLFIVSWCITQWDSSLIIKAGYFFIAGIIIFSGSLYILSLTQIKTFGMITPIGGIAFIIGWGCLALGIYKSNSIKKY
jgi:uncharacterized membrane protein YgdD (TMEM256/DUF423 family)